MVRGLSCLLQSVFPEDADGFEQLCESLKKCRITCTSLSLNMFNVVWNLEQLGILLNILKPVNVTDNSKRSDRLEALLQLTTLVSIIPFTGVIPLR